ncbi:MAG TPA: helix-turn-helix domain-containing protein [Thermoanaerobaculia bacterium]|jgi:transcriptional regulator with XRE-family HTH domain|nr:helix-turn-helix domain-containing protein [Thermoanaerobaculia bacterium]
MLGDVVRETRIKKGLTQARLARLAGVSRRHLAALEKGANVSVAVLKKVAAVLDLQEIQLGNLSLKSSNTGNEGSKAANIALLADAIREARADTERTQAVLDRAEDLIDGSSGGKGQRGVVRFPRLPIRRVKRSALRGARIHDKGSWLELKTAGELRQGKPIDESKKETVHVPKSLKDEGEIVFRARGKDLGDQGIEDGDLLVVQLRQRGRAATGELVIGKIGDNCYVGRWWEKHGRKALMSDGLAEVTVGKSKRVLKVVAVINAILRPEE